MTIARITTSEATKAVVIFAGWGMDAHPFASLHKDGYDIFVVYDYCQPEANLGVFERYDEICIIAWSWGVPAAAEFIKHNSGRLPISATIAVNGTLTPIDDTDGIPEAIFQATLDSLSETSLQKFYRRMCGSASSYRLFAESLPQCDLASLREELQAIRDNGASHQSPLVFDRVIIGKSDLIIPTANQRHAWQGHPCISEAEWPHLPDFQCIIDLYIRDKALIRHRFSSAVNTYPKEADVQYHIATRLFELWRSCDSSEHKDILELGAGCGFLTRHYINTPWCRSTTLVDLYAGTDGVEIGDAETYAIEGKRFDCIVSASTIQWFNSPRRFINRAADALPEGGMMVLSGFGDRHFHELDGLVPKSLFYYSIADFAKLIPDRLQLVRAEEETITIRFTSIRDMLAHLRLTGVNAVSSTQTVAITRRIMSAMQNLPSLTLTYNPTYFILKKI